MVPGQHGVVVRRELPVQFGAFKRGRVLRVRDFLKIKILEFVAPAFTHSTLQSGIAVIREELKGIGLVILLAHEQQRRMRREQQQCGGDDPRTARNQRGQPFALRAIADLIVVLRADYMRWRRDRAGAGAAWTSAPKLKWLALKHKSFVQRADNLPRISKVLIVALAFSGKESMDRVMKVVTPDRVKPIASAAA